MSDHESHHEELLLGWVDGTLDPEQQAVVEQLIGVDPELGRRLEAMRRHRRLAGGLADPPVPDDLDHQIERAIARPLLSPPSPGQYRRRNRPPVSLAWVRRPALAAAVILCATGLLAALVLINPLQIFVPADAPQITRNPNAMDSFRTGRVDGGDVIGGGGGERIFGAAATDDIVVAPQPLALVLPASNDDDMLAMLRLLALRTDATLLVNASAADLLDPALEASAAGGGSGEPPLLMEIEGVLLGDASQVPTMDDQFVYADLGATWTVTTTLERFEEFLQVLDEIAESRGELVLLEDHLNPVAGGDWFKTLRARNRWRTWTDGAGTEMIEIPVFVADPSEVE